MFLVYVSYNYQKLTLTHTPECKNIAEKFIRLSRVHQRGVRPCDHIGHRQTTDTIAVRLKIHIKSNNIKSPSLIILKPNGHVTICLLCMFYYVSLIKKSYFRADGKLHLT